MSSSVCRRYFKVLIQEMDLKLDLGFLYAILDLFSPENANIMTSEQEVWLIRESLRSIFSNFIYLEGNWGTFWLLPVGGALWKGHGMHEDGTEHRLRCWHVSYQPLRVLPHLPHQGECGALWVLDRLDSVMPFSRDVTWLLTTWTQKATFNSHFMAAPYQ